MAPSSGHLLVPKILRIFKQTKALIKSKLPTSYESITSNPSLQPVRVYAQNQPIHPLAYLKQARSSNQQNRFFATRTFTTSPKATGFRPRYDRSKFPVSRISKAISARGAAPFASTLRPNLTGGALPRSAGGYGLSGSGARHFSHTSGAQAQVVQNVSAGIRAFCVGGGKASFDGVDPVTGQKKYRSITVTEDKVYNAWEQSHAKSTRGTNLEFRLNPTITALSPSFSQPNTTQSSTTNITSLNDINLLDNLASDVARALRDLFLILADLRLLSTFGDLPITLVPTSTGSILQVRFAGCDADLVSRLCDEIGVRRGIVVEDTAWNEEKDVEMALLFPFAPAHRAVTNIPSEPISDDAEYYFHKKSPLNQAPYSPEKLEWRTMLSPGASSAGFATLHRPGTKTTPSACGSAYDYDFAPQSDHDYDDGYNSPLKTPSHSTVQSQDYEGVEGIYNFLQECDEGRRVR